MNEAQRLTTLRERITNNPDIIENAAEKLDGKLGSLIAGVYLSIFPGSDSMTHEESNLIRKAILEELS